MWWSSCHAGEATWLTRFSAQRPFVLNIAEGAGEFAPKEKARFTRMARRSANESAAVLDVCRNLKLLADERHAAGRDLLLQVVSMLGHRSRTWEEKRARAGAEARAGKIRRGAG